MSAHGADVVVSGGRVVTATDVVETDVVIKNGRIAALGAASLFHASADRVIDATG